MTKLQRLERENDDLRDELDRLRIQHAHLDNYYRRANSAVESLIQDVVTFMGPGGLVPHSIYGSHLLAALGKANALYHGLSPKQ